MADNAALEPSDCRATTGKTQPISAANSAAHRRDAASQDGTLPFTLRSPGSWIVGFRVSSFKVFLGLMVVGLQRRERRDDRLQRGVDLSVGRLDLRLRRLEALLEGAESFGYHFLLRGDRLLGGGR